MYLVDNVFVVVVDRLRTERGRRRCYSRPNWTTLSPPTAAAAAAVGVGLRLPTTTHCPVIQSIHTTQHTPRKRENISYLIPASSYSLFRVNKQM